jgi:hypothetical protein
MKIYPRYQLQRKICLEYQNQLHIDAEKDNYLLRRITERFFVELENHFHRVSNPIFGFPIKNIGVEEYNKILDKSNDYREMMISLQKDWIRKQLEVIDRFDKKYKFSKLEKELHNAIDTSEYDDNIILIDKLAQKYSMSNKEIHDFIFTQWPARKGNNAEPDYYNYKNKQYLVVHSLQGVNSCLVSRPKVDKLKSLLFDEMHIKDAYLILHTHDIPESFYYDIVRELGFDVKNKSDYSYSYLATPNHAIALWMENGAFHLFQSTNIHRLSLYHYLYLQVYLPFSKLFQSKYITNVY